MAEAKPIDDAAIREKAYYLWEADGRPHGSDGDYWARAVAALSSKPKADKPAKKPVPKAKADPVKLKAAASKTKSAPTKSVKPVAAKKPAKPKKK